MFHISNINTLKSIYCPYFQSIIKYGIILGGNLSNNEKNLLYKTKSSEFWLVHELELHVEVSLNI
jgi:hypothetical protein